METLAYLHLALVHEEPIDVGSSAEWEHLNLLREISWGKVSSKAWVNFLSIAVALSVLGIASQAMAQVLRQGSIGPEVTAIQQGLQRLGYFNSSIDGRFGSLTKVAIQRFQQDYQLSQDGIYGPETEATLERVLLAQGRPRPTQSVGFNPSNDRVEFTGDNGDKLQLGDTGPRVEALQRQLRNRGFDPILIDGIYGVRTQSAVRDFEQSRGLYADGIADSKTLAALDVVVGSKKNRYVVVVPGSYETRIKVMECVGIGSLEKDRRGFYVDAGSFSNYHAAESRSEYLRSCKLDARVVRR